MLKKDFVAAKRSFAFVGNIAELTLCDYKKQGFFNVSRETMAIFLFLISFSTYLYTLYPSVSPFRDAGDLTASVFTLGIAHPPGYPVYVILGKIWTILVPFGNIGYRLNLFSAFTSSLCGIFIFLIVKKRLGSSLLGVISSFILFFSTAFWRQSILAEIYSMNALFAVLLVYLLFSDTKATAVLLAAFLFGLGLGNHHTLVLLLPVIIYLLIIKRLGKTFLHSTFYLLPAFLLGFSVYLFLPVRAKQQPLNNWGNPQTISSFANVLMRTDYGTIKLSSRYSGAADTLTDSAKMFWRLLKNQVGWLGIILTASGVFFSFRNKFGKTMLFFFLFTGPFFIFLSRLPNNEFSLAMLEPACVLPSVFIALIIGMGIGGLLNIIKGQILFSRILPPLFLILPVFLFEQNFRQLNKRNNFLCYDYGKNLLRSIPTNSYLLMTADIPIFTINYLQNVEKRRRDVKVILSSFMPWRIAEYKQKYPEIFYNEPRSSSLILSTVSVHSTQERQGENSVSTVDMLLKKSDKEPVFTEGVHPGLENYVSPRGLACRVIKNTTTIQKAEKVRQSGFLFELFPFRKPKNQLDYYEKTVISYYTDASVNAGVILSQAGRQKEAEVEFLRKSEYEK